MNSDDEDIILGEDVTRFFRSSRIYILLKSDDGTNYYRPDEPPPKTESTAAGAIITIRE